MNIDRNNRDNNGKTYRQNERTTERTERPERIEADRSNTKRTAASSKQNEKKKHLRLDQLIGRLTFIIIIIFGVMIFCDVKGIGRSANRPKQVAAETKTDAPAKETSKSGYTGDKKIVCIDAGHGGKDSGAESGGFSEKDQTLEISNLVKQNLEEKGITVIMTRTTDAEMDPEDRVDAAESANAAILVSIHRNYYEGGSSAHGVEAWIYNSSPSGAKSLANDILTQLVKINGVTNRGTKTGTIANANRNYAINESKCTSCIIELGFITNKTDNTLVTTNKSKCAKAIADGIINYINEVEKK